MNKSQFSIPSSNNSQSQLQTDT